MNQPDWLDIIEDILELIEKDARATETNPTQDATENSHTVNSTAINDYSLDA